MIRSVSLLAVIVLLAGPLRVILLRARWTSLAPRTAIALWQAVVLASTVAIVGLCILLTSMSRVAIPHRRPVTDFTARTTVSHPVNSIRLDQSYQLTVGIIVAALLLGALGLQGVALVRAGARHRALLDLLAVESPEIPGTMLLDHPHAAAYSLPGFRPRVVVSRGAVDALTSDELAAVLAHEKAHIRARHDLVLLPFRCVTSVFPESHTLGAVSDAVHGLVEMAADDRAIRQCGSSVLARAICTMATAGSGEETPVPSRSEVVPLRSTQSVDRLVARIERACAAPRSGRLIAFSTGLSTIGVLALPLVVLLFVPVGR